MATKMSRRGMRILLVTLAFALAGTLAVDLEPGSAPSAARSAVSAKPKPPTVEPAVVQVAFVREGRLVRVERVVPRGVSHQLHALRELVQGPTKLERRRGLRSALRPGVRVRFVRTEGELWVARFSRSLLSPATAATMRTRLAQVSATLSRLRGDRRWLAVTTEGRFVTMLRLGVRPGPWRASEGDSGYDFSIRGVQLRLWMLGYLSRADVTGSLEYRTSQALLAFQGWEGLARTGGVTEEVQVELLKAKRPRATSRRPGRAIEIHRDLGVLLAIEDGEVVRAIHTSTGAGGITPAGSFNVYRKESMSWSVPFSVWMPYAAYFVGGIATHEYPDVPSYPASHGCVRLPAGEAERVYAFVEIGTPVRVY
jgi:hypothetical protein